MARIEQEFGVDLPLSALFLSPTVEELARRLRRTDVQERESCLVPIQPKGESPPFFCIPGAGGNVLYLYELARRLGMNQPFYGLQALGLDRQSQAAHTVEESARHYVGVIRSVQPEGPYFLGGHSFGGQVAYETARQLMEEGDEVGLLAIFDTNAPQTIENPSDIHERDDVHWLCEIGTVIEHLSNHKLNLSYNELKGLDSDERLLSFRKSVIKSGWLPEETTQDQLATLLEVYKANVKANYMPMNPIPTRIALFRASEAMVSDESYTSPDLDSSWGWDEYAAGEVQVHIVSGNHLTMMTEPHVNELAAKLRETLNAHREHLEGLQRQQQG